MKFTITQTSLTIDGQQLAPDAPVSAADVERILGIPEHTALLFNHSGFVPAAAVVREACEELIGLTEAGSIAGLSPDYLRQAALRQAIPAIKIGRNWLISRRWAERKGKR